MHQNPFLGKCIHGKDGASFIGGHLTNSTCRHCTPGVKKRSSEWELEDAFVILDPDGWDRQNFEASWREPISWAEYESRRDRSTVRGKSTIKTRNPRKC